MKKSLLTVAWALIATGAHGAVITSSFGDLSALSPVEVNQTGQLDFFDASRGTLTGAQLTINVGASFVFSGTNSGNDIEQASLGAGISFAFGSTLVDLEHLLASSVDLVATTDRQMYVPGQTRTFGPIARSGFISVDLSSMLPSITGSGTFGVTCRSTSDVGVFGGRGNIATTQSSSAGCSGQIEYTYTAAPSQEVPEPTTLAMVGLALASMAGVIRLRKN